MSPIGERLYAASSHDGSLDLGPPGIVSIGSEAALDAALLLHSDAIKEGAIARHVGVYEACDAVLPHKTETDARE